MRLIGFNFTKISIKKLSNGLKDLKINTNININNIEKASTDIIKIKEDILSLKFEYELDYSPNIAKIEIEGNALLAVDSKISKEILKMWEDKKLPDDFRVSILNIIYKKSNIKAIELEEEMNLPTHIPMPVLSKPKEEKE